MRRMIYACVTVWCASPTQTVRAVKRKAIGVVMQALASEPVFHRCVGASASRVEQALTSLPTRFEQCMQTWQSADSSWVQRRLPGMCCSR